MSDDTPKTLRAWKAARAGGGITVHGINIDTGKADKITNVEIEPPVSHADHHVIATDQRTGIVHKLTFA